MLRSYLLLPLAFVLSCSSDNAPSAAEVPDLPEGRLELPACEQSAGSLSPLTTRCQQIVDAEGRVVFLHGINARVEGVFDIALEDITFDGIDYFDRVPLEPIPAFLPEDAQRIRQLGFNFLRLPMQWSGVEPNDESPQVYDVAYLDRVAEIVDHCRAAGLWVLLDFHQDAYSKEIGEDGAPLWAIQPPPPTLLEGPLDDLASRRTSPAVLAAWTTFFDAPEPGPTLRQRFAQMAAFVAARFEGDETVVGLEIFNEPQPFGQGVFETDIANGQIHPFNIEVAEAIRNVDPNRLVFFEPPVVPRNFFDESGLAEAPFPVDGAVYSPHVYTISFSDPDAAERNTFTRATLEPGNESAYLEAVSWGTPLVITEFGYDPNGIRAEEYLNLQFDLHAEFGAGDALWLWKEESQGRWGLHDYEDETGDWSERPGVRRIVSRPKPEAVAGQPQTWRYDPTTQVLEIWFRGADAVDAPSIVYVPAPEDYVEDYVVSCDGLPIEFERDSTTGRVEVPCNGGGQRYIRVAPR
ncbi:MAG: cellulase family glycosylhydrolase [Polyangiales bacterium]